METHPGMHEQVGVHDKADARFRESRRLSQASRGPGGASEAPGGVSGGPGGAFGGLGGGFENPVSCYYDFYFFICLVLKFNIYDDI